MSDSAVGGLGVAGPDETTGPASGAWSASSSALRDVVHGLLASSPKDFQFPAADVEIVTSHLTCAMAELRAKGTDAFIANTDGVETIIAALTLVGARHVAVARACCAILCAVCGSPEGRDVVSCCVSAFSAAADSSGKLHAKQLNCTARSGLALSLLSHKDDAPLVEDALAALAALMVHPTSDEFNRFQAKLPGTVDQVHRTAFDRLHDHGGNAALAQQALCVILATTPSPDMRKQVASLGGAAVAALTLAKHVDKPAIARDAAVAMNRVMDVSGVAQPIGVNLVQLLGTALRRYTDDAQAGKDAFAAEIAGAIMNALSHMRGMPGVWDYLGKGIDVFRLVAGMRRHMADSDAASAACHLLASMADFPEGFAARCSRLDIAGAVPVLLDIMTAHDGDATVVIDACSAFWRLAKDAPTRLQLAERRPVALLLSLLRHYLHSAELVSILVGECLPAVAHEEAAHSLLMDDEAAADTLRLLLEAARLHKADVRVARSVLFAVDCLCKSYADTVATREAGAFVHALECAQSLGTDESVAFAACSALAKVSADVVSCKQLATRGAAAAMFELLKRHTKSSVRVANGACSVLYQLFQRADAPDRSTVAAAAPLLLTALRCHTSNAVFVFSAAHAVAASICAAPDAALAAAPVRTLKLALRQHAGDARTVAAVLKALDAAAQIPADEGMKAVAAAELLPDVIACLEWHGALLDPAYFCFRIIDALDKWRSTSGLGAGHFDRHTPALLAAIARSMRHHMAEDAANVMSCAAIVGLSHHAAYRPHFARGGVIPLLTGVLRRYASSVGGHGLLMERAALGAVAALANAATAPECVALMHTLSVRDVVAAVLVRLGDAGGDEAAEIRRRATQLQRAL